MLTTREARNGSSMGILSHNGNWGLVLSYGCTVNVRRILVFAARTETQLYSWIREDYSFVRATPFLNSQITHAPPSASRLLTTSRDHPRLDWRRLPSFISTLKTRQRRMPVAHSLHSLYNLLPNRMVILCSILGKPCWV